VVGTASRPAIAFKALAAYRWKSLNAAYALGAQMAFDLTRWPHLPAPIFPVKSEGLIRRKRINRQRISAKIALVSSIDGHAQSFLSCLDTS
jgi:hypothetical protein